MYWRGRKTGVDEVGQGAVIWTYDVASSLAAMPVVGMFERASR